MFNSRLKQRIWLIFALIVLTYIGSFYQSDEQTNSQSNHSPDVQELHKNKQSNVQIKVTGTVAKILKEDNEGSRHQRFIIIVGVDHSLLIAHNIDLAPKIENLQVGDEITVYGEYEWNEQGGVMHWTHHDPDNHHPHGWIRHQGQLYQ